jgi:cobalt-precorrin 5A hydrolase
MRIAVIAITSNGARLGRKLLNGLTGVELHVSKRYAGQAGPAKHLFEPTELKALTASLWHKVDAFVFIMATGIVVRMIAEHLQSKQTDPAVVVIDDAGKFAISLLSGHLGGANELAQRAAFICGANPVITTATDANDLPSFDMLAKDNDWVIEDISKVKTLNSLLLDDGEIAVVDRSGKVRSWFHGRGKLSYYDTFVEAIKSRASGLLFVTNQYFPNQSHYNNLLILRPRDLILGIGCNRNTPLEEIEAFVDTHLRRTFLSLKSVARIASAAAKSDETGLLAYAERHGIELVFYGSEELNRVSVPSEPSQYVMAAIGATGVAEPAAILAAGGGRLLLKKVKSPNVTLAIAQICEAEND